MGSRTLPISVTLVRTVAAAGAPLVLAMSNVSSEADRSFQLEYADGRWRCACGALRQLGGWAAGRLGGGPHVRYVGHLAAADAEGACCQPSASGPTAQSDSHRWPPPWA